MKSQPQPQARRGLMVQRAAARNERLLRGIEAQQRLDAHGTHAVSDVPDHRPAVPTRPAESHD
jgi:hypothetical protein